MSTETTIPIVLTEEERKILVYLLAEQLAYWHETLRTEYETKAAAMAAFDADKTVQVYAKLDPQAVVKLRASIESEIEDYLPD